MATLLLIVQGASGRYKGAGSCSYTIYRVPGRWQIDRCPCNRFFPFKYRKLPPSFVLLQETRKLAF
jgi:hypothetical protein